MLRHIGLLAFVAIFEAMFPARPALAAAELQYVCSAPPLEVSFAIVGGHYSGRVSCGNLFLQPDIPAAPLVRWDNAKSGKLYALLMLDFDGDAMGSWPDPVPPGENAPVRHWIVGNIPAEVLSGSGYSEVGSATTSISILQPYRAPHIPVVSDRYGLYLFEQVGHINFAPLPRSIVNFDYLRFLETYQLGVPQASNHFVAVYTSQSPFSGRPFQGNDVSAVWHKNFGGGSRP